MRTVALTSGKAGINRYRTKGGAKPDTLYDLRNAYVTISGSFRPRPGTVIDSLAEGATSLPPGTTGLTTFRGKLVVFADHLIDLSGYPGYELEILTYPNAEDLEAPPTLEKIHFAEPFLGYLYVAAEWSDAQVFHYWLQAVGTWAPNTVYLFNQLVEPTVHNGFTYRANRLGPANPVWTPDTAMAIGDIREPTTPNSYQYIVEDTIGSNPRTSDTEPAWVASPGALVNEDADFGATVPPPTGGTGGTSTPPQEVRDRYGLGPEAPTGGDVR
jgi:hypothetical protein